MNAASRWHAHVVCSDMTLEDEDGDGSAVGGAIVTVLGPLPARWVQRNWDFTTSAPQDLPEMASRPRAVGRSTLDNALLHHMHGRALSDVCEFANGPREVRALIACSKALWAHGKKLVAKKLKRGLDEVLAAVKNRLTSQRQTLAFPGEPAWLDFFLSLRSLFPEGPLLDEYGRPQVLIAGSSTTQAVLGVQWSLSDVDIFCTAKASAQVRQWLKDCGLAWVGKATHSRPYNDQELAVISHVEHIYPLPAAVGRKDGNANAWHQATKADYQSYLENGKALIERPSDAPEWVKKYARTKIGLPGGSADGKFPFVPQVEFRKQPFVQLVVAKEEY